MRIYLYISSLKLLFWLSLSVYLGGMITLGAIAAPVIFHKTEELQASAPNFPDLPQSPAARQLAGELFGQILNRFTYLETAALILLLTTLVLLQPYLKRWAWALALLLVILLGAFYFMNAELTTILTRSRAQWRTAATQTQPEVTAARRAEFDLFHQRSEQLAQIKVYLLLGLFLLGVTMDKPNSKATSAPAPQPAV